MSGKAEGGEPKTFVGNGAREFAAGAPWLPGTEYSWTCKRCGQPVAFAPATRKHWKKLTADGHATEVICFGCFETEYKAGTEIELAPGVIEELLAWQMRN